MELNEDLLQTIIHTVQVEKEFVRFVSSCDNENERNCCDILNSIQGFKHDLQNYKKLRHGMASHSQVSSASRLCFLMMKISNLLNCFFQINRTNNSPKELQPNPPQAHRPKPKQQKCPIKIPVALDFIFFNNLFNLNGIY